MPMQAHLLLGLIVPPSNSSPSFDGTVGTFPFSPRAPRPIINPCAPPCRGGGGIKITAYAGRGESQQDHYAVLGLQRGASPTEIKKAYRLLARKYHPDVSMDVKSGEKFKSIRLAYEVLSDERSRSQYDRDLKFQDSKKRSYQRRWNYEPEIDMDDRRRMYRWAELRQQMRYEYYQRRARASSRQEKDAYKNTVDLERGPFAEVLWFAFSVLFFMQMIGSRLTLLLCAIVAFLDRRLDAGYKMGYVLALVLGGHGGILLSLCISFISWLCGKNSSGIVGLLVLAMWVGVNLSMFAPIPQGAVLVLLYMSIRLQASGSILSM